MRFVLLAVLSVLSLDAASAQPDLPSHRTALTDDQEAALYGLPVLATAGAVYVALRLEDRYDVQSPFFLLPLVSGGAACGAGALSGAPGSCRGALLWGALGAVPGYLAVAAGFALGESDLLSGESVVGLIVLGAVAAVAVPPAAAIAGYRVGVGRNAEGGDLSVAPAVVADPATHRLAPGVQVRVGL